MHYNLIKYEILSHIAIIESLKCPKNVFYIITAKEKSVWTWQKCLLKLFCFHPKMKYFMSPDIYSLGMDFFFMMSFYQIVLFYNLSQTRQNSPLKILKRSCRRRSLRKRRENTLYASRRPKLVFIERKVKSNTFLFFWDGWGLSFLTYSGVT